MTFYPFRNPETGEEWGSFEVFFQSKDDYMWFDYDTCWFPILCWHIGEDEEKHVKNILGIVNEAELDGRDEDFFLNDDEKEVYKRIKKAPAELEGWYWWPSFIGCLPDGEPNGPFKTEEEAIENARGV